jgi:RHS repeat-associated protein
LLRYLRLGLIISLLVASFSIQSYAASMSTMSVGGTIIGGSTQTISGTVTITRSAQNDNGTVRVFFNSSNSDITINSVDILPNATSANFTSNWSRVVSQNRSVTISAHSGEASGTVSGSVTLTPFQVTVTLSPGSIIGGSTDVAIGTITLNAPVKSPSSSGGDFVFLSSSPNVLDITSSFGSGSAFIPNGATSGKFQVFDPAVVTTPQSITITAVYGSTGTTEITINPLPISVTATSVLYSGETGKGEVSIGVHPRIAMWLQLIPIPSGLSFSPYSSVFIGTDATSAPFTFTAPNVTQISNFTIGVQGSSALAPVKVLPGKHPPKMRCKECEAHAGRPIELTSGNVWIDQSDYSIPGLSGGLGLQRTWNSMWSTSLWESNPPVEIVGMFGNSWRSTYEKRLKINTTTNLREYWHADGNLTTFSYNSTSNVYTLAAPLDEHETLAYDASTNQRTITFVNGVKEIFNVEGYLEKIIDRNGNTTTVSYDTHNRIILVTDPVNRTLTFNYPDEDTHLVSSIQDATGTVATYQYDDHTLLLSVTYADQSVINYGYDDGPPGGQNGYIGSRRINSVTDKNGKLIEAHTYDNFNRGLTSVLADGVELVTVTYPQPDRTLLIDSGGNSTDYGSASVAGNPTVTSVTGSTCASCGATGTASYIYDAYGNRTSMTDAAGHTATMGYDGNGNLTSLSQQVGSGTTISSSYTYNNFGQVLTATDPLSQVTNYEYDAQGNLTKVTTPSPDGIAPRPATSFDYYVNTGLLKTITDPRNKVTTLTYWPAGLVKTIEDPGHNVTSFEYDARGNRTSVVDTVSHRTEFTYDAMNRLKKITQSDQTHTDFGYDIRGRRSSVTDANGKSTTYAYDDADRLISVTDANNGVTRYAYDLESNLTSIKDALNRETKYEYNAKRQLTKTTFPSQLYETYTYDDNGNLKNKTDRKGQTITYTYDGADRLKTKAYPDQTGVAYTYDLASRLTQVVDPTGTYQFSYDNLGRQKQATTNYAFLPARTLTVKSGYDVGSNRTSMTNAENESWTYGYDDAGRFTQITDPATQQFGFGYDNLGRRTSLTRPAGANSFNTTYGYDALSRLTSIQHGSAMSFGYGYDNVGNRTSETYVYSASVKSNYVPNGGGSGGSSGGSGGAPPAGTNGTATTAGFAWDDQQILNKIVQGDQTNVVLQPDASGKLTINGTSDTKLSYTFSQTAGGARYDYSSTKTTNYGYDDIYQLTSAGWANYGYDKVGNRTSGLPADAYNSSNQLLSTGNATYTYDLNGNLATKTTGGVVTTYTWDYENRLTSISVTGGATTTFKYDPFGRRIEKNSEIYVYDGANLIETLNAAGAAQSKYTFGPGIDEVLAKGSNLYYADALGSVRMVADKSDAKQMVLYTYDAYGNTTVGGKNPALADRFRYTGREFDAETGIYYYRARYYDPGVGRFLSEDPIGFFGGRNFYAYVGNDPVRDVDSSGLSPIMKSGTGNSSYCMNTTLGQICWGDKKRDLMHVALQHKNLACCVRKFFGNDVSLNMKNLPLIDASHDLHGAAVGTAIPSDNVGRGRGVVQIDKGSFGNLAFDDEFLILTYLHETANALAQHLFTDYRPKDRGFLGPMGAYPSWEQQHDPTRDFDIGNQFEKCLVRK